MSTNKEQAVFALSILIFVGAVGLTLSRGGLNADAYPYLMSWTPAPARFTPQEEVTIERLALKSSVAARDPFQTISDWRSAPADPLPMPPLGDLKRRLPLSGELARSKRARPPRELQMPEAKERDREDEGN